MVHRSTNNNLSNYWQHILQSIFLKYPILSPFSKILRIIIPSLWNYVIISISPPFFPYIFIFLSHFFLDLSQHLLSPGQQYNWRPTYNFLNSTNGGPHTKFYTYKLLIKLTEPSESTQDGVIAVRFMIPPETNPSLQKHRPAIQNNVFWEFGQ